MWDFASVQNRLAVCQNRRSRYLRRSSSTSSPSSSSISSIFLSTSSVLTASAASALGLLGFARFDAAWSAGLLLRPAGPVGRLLLRPLASVFLAFALSLTLSISGRDRSPGRNSDLRWRF
jgi:hypothetical protein